MLKKEESRSIGIYIFFSLSLGCLTLVHVQSTHALALPLLHTDALHSLRFLSLSPTNLSFYIFFTFHPKCRRHYLCVVPEDDQIKIFGKGSTCPDWITTWEIVFPTSWVGWGRVLNNTRIKERLIEYNNEQECPGPLVRDSLLFLLSLYTVGEVGERYRIGHTVALVVRILFLRKHPPFFQTKSS